MRPAGTSPPLTASSSRGADCGTAAATGPQPSCLPSPPPRPHLSRIPAPAPPPCPHTRPPSLPGANPARAGGSRGPCAGFVCWRRGAHTTATRDPTAAPSSGSTHVEPAGPHWSPAPVSRARLRVQFPRRPWALPLVSIHPCLYPLPAFWPVGKPLRLPPAPPAIPGQSRRLPAPEQEGGTREETRAESASRRWASVRSPPLACPLGAGLGLQVPPAPGRPPTHCSSSAGTRLPRRCRQEAPRRRFLHTHVPLVCAPPVCRCYPAGATGISGQPHPPGPQRFAPCIRGLLGVSTAASKTRRRLCEPGCLARLRAAAQGPHLWSPSLAHLFLWTVGFSHCTRTVQPPPTAAWRVQQEGVPEAPTPSLNPSQAFSSAPSSARHPP